MIAGIVLIITIAALIVLIGVTATHTVTVTCNAGGIVVTGNNSYTAEGENNIIGTFAIGTNFLIAFTADVSQQKQIFIMSSTAATLKTNSSGSPAATVTLVAGQPVEWSSTNGQTNPFGSTDITALYLTNAAETDLYLLTLVDPSV